MLGIITRNIGKLAIGIGVVAVGGAAAHRVRKWRGERDEAVVEAKASEVVAEKMQAKAKVAEGSAEKLRAELDEVTVLLEVAHQEIAALKAAFDDESAFTGKTRAATPTRKKAAQVQSKVAAAG